MPEQQQIAEPDDGGQQIVKVVGDASRELADSLWDPLESTCRHASLSIL